MDNFNTEIEITQYIVLYEFKEILEDFSPLSPLLFLYNRLINKLCVLFSDQQNQRIRRAKNIDCMKLPESSF